MKKLLILLLLFPLAASARMFPGKFPVDTVCWDNPDEAIQYHKEVLGEYPVGRGWIDNKNGPTFAAIMFNPVKPSWTFLHFHSNTQSGNIIVCAITGGHMWETLIPGGDEIPL